MPRPETASYWSAVRPLIVIALVLGGCSSGDGGTVQTANARLVVNTTTVRGEGHALSFGRAHESSELELEVHDAAGWHGFYLHGIGGHDHLELAEAGDGMRFAVRARQGPWTIVYHLPHGGTYGAIVVWGSNQSELAWSAVPQLDQLEAVLQAGRGVAEHTPGTIEDPDREHIRAELAFRHR